MNHPERDVVEEIQWMSAMGLQFLDLTLEPPCAATWVVNPAATKSALQEAGMPVVGHTAYYLPLGSPFESLRKASVEEFKACLKIFAEVGAKWMNVHPDRYAPMHPRSFYIKRDIESLREIIAFGADLGVGVMIENLPHDFNDAHQLGELLDPLPELGLHLDYGHSNLEVPKNTAGEILKQYGERLKHVHMHDNRGGNQDLHMPLGTGNIDYYDEVKSLKECGYDGTITLEVFSPDRHFLEYSRDVLRGIWDAV
ncbi:MAG TPA: sugar phosphate isomerase/epimerase family protein [Fimbriimonadaceae bacterium]|jgi:sugar phosphate isomerase/epimerase